MLTERIDWTELLEFVENVRQSKVKNAAGRPPQLRALTGALLLKATGDMTWREAANLIRHYAPAQHLCGLTETEWSSDHRTLHDFATLLGQDGLRLFNEYAAKWAVAGKLADPSMVVGDTTAQEAAIPHPNEMGLIAAFVTSALAASELRDAKFAVKAVGLAPRDKTQWAVSERTKNELVKERALVEAGIGAVKSRARAGGGGGGDPARAQPSPRRAEGASAARRRTVRPGRRPELTGPAPSSQLQVPAEAEDSP